MITGKVCTHRIDKIVFPPHDLDISGQIDLFPDPYDLARVAGWEPYDLHVLRQVSWVESSVLYSILHNISQLQVRI